MRYMTMPSKRVYTFNYQDTRELHERYVSLSDEQFMAELPNILHLAIFISYVKDLSNEATLSDDGIIHELVHLLTSPDPSVDLKEIRKDFEVILKLS